MIDPKLCFFFNFVRRVTVMKTIVLLTCFAQILVTHGLLHIIPQPAQNVMCRVNIQSMHTHRTHMEMELIIYKEYVHTC